MATKKKCDEVKDLEMRIYPGLPGWALRAITHVLRRETYRGETGRNRRPRDHGGRDWSYGATSQGLGGTMKDPPLEPCREHGPANTLNLNLWHSIVRG